MGIKKVEVTSAIALALSAVALVGTQTNNKVQAASSNVENSSVVKESSNADIATIQKNYQVAQDQYKKANDAWNQFNKVKIVS